MPKAKKQYRPKRRGYGLDLRAFHGESGRPYIVFRTPKGSFHVFVETDAKDAARDCGARRKRESTRQRWERLWEQQEATLQQ